MLSTYFVVNAITLPSSFGSRSNSFPFRILESRVPTALLRVLLERHMENPYSMGTDCDCVVPVPCQLSKCDAAISHLSLYNTASPTTVLP